MESVTVENLQSNP